MKEPTLKPIFEEQAKRFTCLYGTDDRSWIRAIICTMLTNGNGYRWVNGKYIDTLGDIEGDLTPNIDPEMLDEIEQKMIRETNDLCPQISADNLPGEWCGLYHTPEDVTDEYLEICEFVFEYIFQASGHHFYFSRHGMHGKVEPTRIYNHTAECLVKHHFWEMYKTVKQRVSRIKDIEKPTSAYNPINTKTDRDEQVEIVKEIMNEIFQEEVGENRYESED